MHFECLQAVLNGDKRLGVQREGVWNCERRLGVGRVYDTRRSRRSATLASKAKACFGTFVLDHDDCPTPSNKHAADSVDGSTLHWNIQY